MHNDSTLREKLLDSNQSFLVQAPAGSGKTSILVQRYLSVLAIANEPEEILAITFTRKAVGEMRERILNALQLAQTAIQPTNSYDRKLWELGNKVLAQDKKLGWNLLENPVRLKIQTIDALCTSITKQMPILSRFGAQPQIAKDPNALYVQAVNQMLHNFDNEPNYLYRDSLYKILQHLDNDRLKARQLLQDVLRKRESWLPLLMQHSGLQNLRDFLEQGLVLAGEEALRDLQMLRPEELDLTIIGEEEPQTITQWLTIIDKLLTNDGTWRKTVTSAQGFHAPSKATNQQEKLQLQAAKTAMLTMLERLQVHADFRQGMCLVRQLPPVMYTEPQWGMVEALIMVLPVLAAQLSVVFRDHGQVDFVEVAMAAIYALQNEDAPTELALALDCKLKHILVDEFQDTSHTQFQLLAQLTNSWENGDGRTLFLVGDPMQSIYSFRQAEVGLFIKAREQGIGNLDLEFVQLTTNFRATPSIIHWINNLFTHSFPLADNKTLGAIAYTKANPANTVFTQAPAANCIAVHDAGVPAEIIKIINDQDANAKIAILVRTRSHLDKILPALRNAQIPFNAVDIENLQQRPIIQDLLSLTKAILHLDDRIAWLAILRAPWCGLGLADLEIIAEFEDTIFAALQAPSVQSTLTFDAKIRVAHFAAVMQDAIALVGRCDLAFLVQTAARNLGTPYGMQYEIEAYWSFLTQIASRPEIYNPGYIEQELAKLFLQATQTIPDNAVQIMTIHKAKGLEFDVVILPHLDKNTKNNDQELLLLEQRDYDHQYLLLAPMRSATDEDAIYKYLSWCRKQRDDYETLRELYVALTRAKHSIYCLANVEANKANGMLKHVWPYIANQFNNYEQAELLQPMPDRSLRRWPSTWFANNRYAAHNIAKSAGGIWRQREHWVSYAGTIMHRILCNIATIGIENIEPNYISTVPAICMQHLQTTTLNYSDQERAQTLIMQAVNNMLHDPFGIHILSARHKEAYSEWSLTTVVAQQCMQVRLDRVFLDKNDMLWLIDYKLVQNADFSTAIHEYTLQVRQYAQILQQIKPEYKLTIGLYFPLQKVWHEIAYATANTHMV